MDVPKASRKQRNRVPISCLNCKKRKVKCDKVKPACGGCVKNQVAHLCHYLEPLWAETPGGAAEKPHDSAGEELRVLRAANEKVISHQRREIESLKRQLVALETKQPVVLLLAPALGPPTSNKAITILHKLNPDVNDMREGVEVVDDLFLSFAPISGRPASSCPAERCIHIYSWLNIIKLDPQLTNLWFKITSLQKVYHTYKMNLISNGSPRKPRPKFKINEIDFTYSLSPPTPASATGPGTQAHARAQAAASCPVVECDFNFMADDVANTRAPTPRPVGDLVAVKLEDDPLAKFYLFSDSSAVVLKRLQALWDTTVNLGRGNDRLSGPQLTMLLDFYFGGAHDADSVHLLGFFRQHISLMVREDASGALFLNLNIQAPTEESLFVVLKAKGTYLCMLALVVEESLDLLRQRVDADASDEVTARFRRQFPAEAVYAGLGYKENGVVVAVQEFLCHLHREGVSAPGLRLSLAVTVACVAVLGRQIALYRRLGPGASLDPRPWFSRVFKCLLTLLEDSDGVRIWKDPAQVTLLGAGDGRTQELRLLLCHVWNDFVRLMNMVCFDFVSLVKSENDLNRLVIGAYSRIEEAENNLWHVRYLSRIGGAAVDPLITSFHVNYLISRSFTVLYCGVCQFGDVCLTVSILAGLMKEAATWAHDPELSKLPYCRYLEAQCMLLYIEFYMTYLCLLQSEESQDDDIVQMQFHQMLVRCSDFNRQLQKFISYDYRNPLAQYMLLAVTETLGRLIQLIVGLLIRLKAPSDGDLALIYSNGRKSIVRVDAAVRDELIKHTDDTLSLLNQSLLNTKQKVTKLSKLWNFYLTFIKNSQKMNPYGYAKLHADVAGFSSLGKLMAKCPVTSHDQVEIKQELAERISRCPVHTDADGTPEPPGKCPVDHENKCPVDHQSKCPVDHQTPKCPVDHRQFQAKTSPKTEPDLKKRKCPFDHEAMRFMPKTFHESHVRGSEDYKKPKSPRFHTPPPMVLAPAPAPPMEMTVSATMALAGPPRPTEMLPNEPFPHLNSANVNLNDFPNFDLDFLQNEAWFEQLGLGELETPPLEGFFQ